jgi:hypothetical protein
MAVGRNRTLSELLWNLAGSGIDLIERGIDIGIRVIDWRPTPAQSIAAAAVLLIVVDTFIKPLSSVALGLAFLGVLPWLTKFVKSAELPGGLKFELKEQLDKVTFKAIDAGLFRPPRYDEEKLPAYQTIFESDPVLALAGLRIELERRLRRLARLIGIRESSITRLMSDLTIAGVLTQEQHSVVADLMPLLNRAVHAGDIDYRAGDWAIEVGPRLLAALDEKIAETERGLRQ